MATRLLRFAPRDDVRLSIIMLVLAEPGVALRSLASLVDTIDSTLAYEVIIVCNGLNTADVTTLERYAMGARLIVCGENTGFSGGCNVGATAARAEYLLFLNDDTIVEPGSIAALLRAADEEPAAGAIGSMMLFVDGIIQECGSIVWRDGSTMPVGRGTPATSMRYAFRRRVDYCSACSLLVRRAAFNAVGGFDESYFPAYYEDADFALKLRAAGWSTYVEPLSRVRHIEGASTTSRFRQFLFKRNRRRFVRKWGTALQAQPEARPTDSAAVERAIALARGVPIRILVCDDRLPAGDVGSGYRRMLELLDDLDDPMFAITFALSMTLDGDHESFSRRGIEIIDEPLDVYLRRPGVWFDVIIMSRPHNYDRWAALIRATLPSSLFIYDTESLFHRRLFLQAEFAAGAGERARYLAEARDMERLERRIAQASDRIVCIATEEYAYLQALPDHAPIDLMRPVLRNIAFTERSFDGRADVLFVAGWLAGPTAPNADGFLWFVREVWPHIEAAVPNARFLVTGANPPENVRSRFGRSIVGLGNVKDLRDVYEHARVVVVPMRYGAGVKIKTIEAIQSGCPTVATTIGAEGFAVSDRGAIDVCDDPREFAQLTIALLRDDERWNERRSALRRLLALWNAEAAVNWQTVIERALSDASNSRREKVPRATEEARCVSETYS